MPPNKDEVKIDLNDSQAVLKLVLKTLTERCDEEAINNYSNVPFSNKQARIKHYTGLSNSIVEKLLFDTTEKTQLDLSSRILILNTVKSYYVQHRLPTYNNIYGDTRDKLKTKKDQTIIDINELINEMNILGYVLKETVNNSEIVMEDPEIRFERFMYLHVLKKYRSNSVQWPQIIYIDERVINLSYKFEKPAIGTFQTESTDLEQSIFYHAVSKTGYVAGMFSNHDNFNRWIMDVLIVHLRTPSIIIMDTLHGPPENMSSITRYHSKSEMLKWLTSNNIPCSSNMSKPALFELIAKCNENRKEYHTDRILQSHGHEVLRLPRHLYDLSITTPLWNNLKENGRLEETNSLTEMQSTLLKKITSIPASTWAEYEQDIEKTEKEIFNIDTTMENFCDMYEIKI